MSQAGGRPLLVLDLDETLLHASEVPLERPADFEVFRYWIYRRPNAEGFLRHAARSFRLGVWTSSGRDYAQAVCDAVVPAGVRLEFLWANDRCTMRRDFESDAWIQAKPMSKLRRRGWDLRRLLVIDDSPEKHRQNYGNLVRVLPYEGDPADDELRHLAAYLDHLRDAPDYRRVEKRWWRGQGHAPVEFARMPIPEEQAQR